MWQLLPKVHHETIGLCITPDTLIISWIQPHQGSSPYIIKAYKEIKLSPTTFCHDHLFNPTALQLSIRSFVQTYGLENAYMLCAIHGSGMQERFTSHIPPYPDTQTKHVMRLQQYLYTLDNSEKIFYHVSMPSTLVMQYMLLALHARLNLIALVSHFTAYLALYQRIHASAFRRAQLAQDMQKHHHQLYNMFTHEQIKRLVTAPAHIDHSIPHAIPLALGLFLLGTDHETSQLH